MITSLPTLNEVSSSPVTSWHSQMKTYIVPETELQNFSIGINPFGIKPDSGSAA